MASTSSSVVMATSEGQGHLDQIQMPLDSFLEMMLPRNEDDEKDNSSLVMKLNYTKDAEVSKTERESDPDQDSGEENNNLEELLGNAKTESGKYSKPRRKRKLKYSFDFLFGEDDQEVFKIGSSMKKDPQPISPDGSDDDASVSSPCQDSDSDVEGSVHVASASENSATDSDSNSKSGKLVVDCHQTLPAWNPKLSLASYKPPPSKRLPHITPDTKTELIVKSESVTALPETQVDPEIRRALNKIINSKSLETVLAYDANHFPTLFGSCDQAVLLIFGAAIQKNYPDLKSKRTRDLRVSECPMTPRFLKITAIVNSLMNSSDFEFFPCKFLEYLEKTIENDAFRDFEATPVLEALGRFVGALCRDKSHRGLEILFKFCLFRGPFAYPFAFGVLCANSEVLGWYPSVMEPVDLSITSRSVIYYLVKNPRFGNSVRSTLVNDLLKKALLVPVFDITFAQFFDKICDDVALGLEGSRRLEESSNAVALCLVALGKDWMFGKLRSLCMRWLQQLQGKSRDEAGFRVVIDGSGRAILALRRGDTPNCLKEAIEIYKILATTSWVESEAVKNICADYVQKFAEVATRGLEEPVDEWLYDKRIELNPAQIKKNKQRKKNEKRKMKKAAALLKLNGLPPSGVNQESSPTTPQKNKKRKRPAKNYPGSKTSRQDVHETASTPSQAVADNSLPPKKKSKWRNKKKKPTKIPPVNRFAPENASKVPPNPFQSLQKVV